MSPSSCNLGLHLICGCWVAALGALRWCCMSVVVQVKCDRCCGAEEGPHQCCLGFAWLLCRCCTCAVRKVHGRWWGSREACKGVQQLLCGHCLSVAGMLHGVWMGSAGMGTECTKNLFQNRTREEEQKGDEPIHHRGDSEGLGEIHLLLDVLQRLGRVVKVHRKPAGSKGEL